LQVSATAWIWQSQSVRPQALSATSQMDAWAALSATSQMDAGQHYPRPRRWTLTQGMEHTRMKGHAWQLTLFWMHRS